MVAKITIPSSIQKALNYNEQKVKQGKARCIHAHQFLSQPSDLNFHQKLLRFQQQIQLNQRAQTNTVHISLNFAPGETIPAPKLVQIASTYMDKIGFGNQPYLVYEHQDAGHPHIHIVTTNIRPDGKRISLHNIGKKQSSQARKEIERIFQLQKADRHRPEMTLPQPFPLAKLNYGKSPTRQAMANILNQVLPSYHYTSLAQLNAVLSLYNILADRGKEEGVMYRKKGLHYRVLDSTGNKIGVPLKASCLPNKPTLAYLESRFASNETVRQAHQKSLKNTLDWVLKNPPASMQAFQQKCQAEKISVILRQNNSGLIYGLTYIDHRSKCVFNGSELGKAYSANGLQKTLQSTTTQNLQPTIQQTIQPLPKTSTGHSQNILALIPSKITSSAELSNPLEVVANLTETHSHQQASASQYKKRKKKRKKSI